MARLSPYLNLNGKCREAMNFYREALGGDLVIDTFGGTPMAGEMPAEMRDLVMHSMLTSGDIIVMATDGFGDGAPAAGGAVKLALHSETREEITNYFDKLAVGGTVEQPLEEAFFGLYGALTDRYGISWMFQGGSGPGA